MSLEKIANRQQLSKQDIVAAAHELFELEKQAAEADAYGRSLAHELVKQAADEAPAEETEEEKAEKEKEAAKKKKEAEKKSSDTALEGAIEVLKKAGVIK
jgi:hypothetical protein